MSHHFVRFSSVSYIYPSGDTGVDNISFLIRHGEKVALLGLNGAGKSTLLLLADALLMPTSGEINIGDVPLTKQTLSQIRRNVGLVFQNPDDQLFMPSVEEDVAFGPRNMLLSEHEVERRVEEALKAVGACDLRYRSPLHLSGGQKRAVAIATVLSMKPSILALDEPSANLDPASRCRLIEIIKKFDHTVLLATHDLEMALELCPRTLLLAKGSIIADAPTREILEDDALLTRAGIFCS